MEQEPIYLSRLQHYLFCPRQFGLIELESIWAENQFTAEGQVLHQRVNQPDQQKRGAIRTVWALRLAHAELGIEGVADVVEYHKQADGTEIPYPIEYKRGKPQTHRADEVQFQLVPKLELGNQLKSLSRIIEGVKVMTEHVFDNIWDALESDPIERANLQLRSQLLSALIDALEQNGMTQTRSANLLGIDEPSLTNLMAGRIDLFTIDNLVNMLEKTGRHITLSIAA
ncbi:MAG: hypothetical protein RIQ94_1707 [Pseudomonadota bacterium]|jgi:predicted XRE-type DNA-binding protein